MSYLELLRASVGSLSRWSRLHLQSLATSNPHWARVEGYGPFSLCVIHKEGLCPSSGDINRLTMMMTKHTWRQTAESEFILYRVMIMMIHTYHSRFIPEEVLYVYNMHKYNKGTL
jgi:hypothetical protein